VLETARADTMVASEGFVRDVDALQYGIGEGPCLLAVEVRAIQLAGSLGGEQRWPRFGPRAGRMGVHSALSLPLLVKDQLVGALNVYGRAHHAFNTSSVRCGEQFARRAAVTVANALLLEESRRLAEQLSRALVSHTIIERAIGIGMSRSGSDAGEAFERLRERSQSSRTKLVDVASQIVDSAVGRARARRRQAGSEADPD
jgi:signal transduction protein with GAF and PtsI domain